MPPPSQSIPPLFKGQAAVLFASGPSLNSEVIETIRPYHEAGKVKAFGCNDTYKVVDYLDVHYACDGLWWTHHPDALKELPPEAHVWTQDHLTASRLKINLITGTHSDDLCMHRPNHIHYGSNSGFQQLNIAYHYGITKFILVGYNMGPIAGKSHFFGDHPQPLKQKSPYPRFIQQFNTISIKSQIINCTPDSALRAFPYNDLKETLELL